MRLHLILPLLLLFHPALAPRIGIEPPASAVAIRFYGLGLLPIDGNYTRFQGRLTYDPNDPADCQVVLTIDAASLVMTSESMRNEVMGPEFMDVARYPTLAFSGTCRGPTLEGDLTMHGVTHAFALSLDWQPGSVTATGRLHRAEWGMTSRLLLGGATVRIRVSAPLPQPQSQSQPQLPPTGHGASSR
jgi:polyisoprenoid-binding protein YceI